MNIEFSAYKDTDFDKYLDLRNEAENMNPCNPWPNYVLSKEDLVGEIEDMDLSRRIVAYADGKMVAAVDLLFVDKRVVTLQNGFTLRAFQGGNICTKIILMLLQELFEKMKEGMLIDRIVSDSWSSNHATHRILTGKLGAFVVGEADYEIYWPYLFRYKCFLQFLEENNLQDVSSFLDSVVTEENNDKCIYIISGEKSNVIAEFKKMADGSDVILLSLNGVQQDRLLGAELYVAATVPIKTLSYGVFRVLFSSAEGKISIEHRGERLVCQLFDQFGPPYVSFRNFNDSVSFNVDSNEHRMIITADYYNGITISKEIICMEEEVRIDTWIKNISNSKHNISIKRITNCLLRKAEIVLNGTQGAFVTPILYEYFPSMKYHDLSQSPKDYSAAWSGFYGKSRFIAYSYGNVAPVETPYLKKIRYGNGMMPTSYFFVPDISGGEQIHLSNERIYIKKASTVMLGIEEYSKLMDKKLDVIKGTFKCEILETVSNEKEIQLEIATRSIIKHIQKVRIVIECESKVLGSCEILSDGKPCRIKIDSRELSSGYHAAKVIAHISSESQTENIIIRKISKKNNSSAYKIGNDGNVYFNKNKLSGVIEPNRMARISSLQYNGCETVLSFDEAVSFYRYYPFKGGINFQYSGDSLGDLPHARIQARRLMHERSLKVKSIYSVSDMDVICFDTDELQISYFIGSTPQFIGCKIEFKQNEAKRNCLLSWFKQPKSIRGVTSGGDEHIFTRDKTAKHIYYDSYIYCYGEKFNTSLAVENKASNDTNILVSNLGENGIHCFVNTLFTKHREDELKLAWVECYDVNKENELQSKYILHDVLGLDRVV